MSFKAILLLVFVLSGAMVNDALAQTDDSFAAIGQSHIAANVPDKRDFEAILKRDLTKYVADPGDKGVTVTVELLRDTPTQAGVAFPKFYCWIRKTNAKGVLIEEAAARIAAVEKTHFEVIQYYDRKRMLAEPDLMEKIFPADVYARILQKLKANEK